MNITSSFCILDASVKQSKNGLATLAHFFSTLGKWSASLVGDVGDAIFSIFGDE
jgi:hypothetical protein